MYTLLTNKITLVADNFGIYYTHMQLNNSLFLTVFENIIYKVLVKVAMYMDGIFFYIL